MIVGLFIRNIKAYENINFVPLIDTSHNLDNFTAYLGENGVGKSAILEALNAFFNNELYIINENITKSGFREGKSPFILPIFLLDKQKTKERYSDNNEYIEFFEKLSEYFWNIDYKDNLNTYKAFFDLRDYFSKSKYKETHYLFIFGEEIQSDGKAKPYFPAFARDINKDDELDNKLNFCKEMYNYIYFPVEIDIQTFTKLETTHMQKLIGRKLKDEVTKSVQNVEIDDINNKLESFLNSIKESLNNKYEYKVALKQKSKITLNDLVEKILAVYFEKKILHKGKKKVSELSAGEKRQALIELCTAFLKESEIKDKNIIIALDEPESSLHLSSCYEQFEKLQDASKFAQILITTHWYGFLPIVNNGYVHILNKKDKIIFNTYTLHNYTAKIMKNNELPSHISLKSMNDLVQSIYHSIITDNPYNYLIVEGISDKIYFDVFFSDFLSKNRLRILALDGCGNVKKFYEYIRLPINENQKEIKGKIYCLIDTDSYKIEISNNTSDDKKHLQFKRLSHKGKDTNIELLDIKNDNTTKTDIEQCLNPIIFKETYEQLGLIEKYNELKINNKKGNTNFTKNLKNTELEDYFKENGNKTTFARKYIDVLKSKENMQDYIPSWIIEIKNFFEKSE